MMMRIVWLATFAAILVMAGFSLYGASAIPEDAMIARHWNLAGEADGFSPRNHVLVAMPALALLIAIVFALVPMIDPRKRNVAASRGLLFTSWLGAMTLLAVAHGWIVLTAARGETAGAPPPHVILYTVSALLVAIGNFVAKSRSNFFLGVRTPWTLSSEYAWSVANRAGGYMLVLTGVAAAAAAAGYLIDLRTGMLTLVAGALATAVVSIAVSYFAWRSDPERGGPESDAA